MGIDRANQIRDLLHEFWTSDWRVIDRFADDAVLLDPMLPGPARGKPEILETFKACHSWADLKPELRNVIAADDLAAAEFVVKGVVTAPLDDFGDAAIGAEFSFGETDVFEFGEDGLVRRMSIYADVAGFNSQLKKHILATSESG